jgi:ABC-2 type transport system ATP-binding protein
MPMTGAEADMLLTVTGLAAGYGRLRVVEGVELSVAPGMWLGLLGANGSGKSTLLRAVTGQIPLQAGQVLIGGVDLAVAPEAAKRGFGYAVDGAELPASLTGRQYLELVASVRGCAADDWPCGDLVALLGLGPWIQVPIGDCSLGTRMKVSLAAALLGGPKLLILDESLNGLDPVVSWRMRAILTELVQSGRHGVVLSTHMVETVAVNCSDAVFLEGGRIAHRWGREALAASRGVPGGFEAVVMQAMAA